MTVAQNASLKTRDFLQGTKSFFCTVLLQKTNNTVDNENKGNDLAFENVAKKKGNQNGKQKKPDQNAVELLYEELPQ